MPQLNINAFKTKPKFFNPDINFILKCKTEAEKEIWLEVMKKDGKYKQTEENNNLAGRFAPQVKARNEHVEQ